MAFTRKAEEERTPERPSRIPVSGSRDILTVAGKDPSYVYRWVNDTDGRIARFRAAGYEFVEHEVGVGQRTTDSAKGVEKGWSKDVGQGITAYLMRIKREWFEEDQAAKQANVDRSEESLFRQLNKGGDGSYGKVTTK